MTDELEKLLNESEDQTYFILVGYAHLAGEDSILERLMERGYEVISVNEV
ncbi:hypothetical protein Nther_1053 [Natranaerobius thermophilus JW/NM-WN-LF]|uniref:TraB/GumN family protein n=1 Tax=Natranaerobius thermophilus (strain ATCC BAA-1301 / DSM 18059 / JW/NM-WN-LF) TaxID=457570 RepID=B2A114_NATTJ|nr:hypothetical protein Nther_1053 [Natranaerobius thermophilus JW/NM-WN-LF]